MPDEIELEIERYLDAIKSLEVVIKAKDETISALSSEVQFLRGLLTKQEKQAAPTEPQAVKFPPIYDDTTKKYREMTSDELIEHRAYMQEILGVS